MIFLNKFDFFAAVSYVRFFPYSNSFKQRASEIYVMSCVMCTETMSKNLQSSGSKQHMLNLKSFYENYFTLVLPFQLSRWRN